MQGMTCDLRLFLRNALRNALCAAQYTEQIAKVTYDLDNRFMKCPMPFTKMVTIV